MGEKTSWTLVECLRKEYVFIHIQGLTNVSLNGGPLEGYRSLRKKTYIFHVSASFVFLEWTCRTCTAIKHKMCQFASHLKKRRTLMASNGRWLLNRIINIGSHQMEDGVFIKLPILGLTHAPWIGWDRDRSCTLWRCSQKTSFSTFIYFFGGGDSSQCVHQICTGTTSQRPPLQFDGAFQGWMSVTTKPINLKRGRTRKAPPGCAEALEGIPLCESLNFSTDFTKSN